MQTTKPAEAPIDCRNLKITKEILFSGFDSLKTAKTMLFIKESENPKRAIEPK